MAKKREIVVTKHEPIMYLTDALCDKILNIMFVAKDNERKDYHVGYNEISLMNLMFIFLNQYTGSSITTDFYKAFKNNEKEYTYDFYIYFIYNYYQMFKDSYSFSWDFNFYMCL